MVHAEDKSFSEKARAAAEAVVDKTKEVARDTKELVSDAAHHAQRTARSGWAKTKAYVSDELPVYRAGANETLAALAREILEVKAETPIAAPVYLRTRILALDEQHQYLSTRLALLSPEQLRNRSSGPRYNFDQCVGDLEQAIDQTKESLGTVSGNTLTN
ncbi:MAG: hypothetical protein JWL59_3510 [Chthoniobacteraceae bacterium]|nr:hypothetical protein [Chthoniobacteraceae bacterium]